MTCAIMDGVGIDAAGKISHYWAEESGRPEMKRNAVSLKEHFVDRGTLGIKTGEGFYSYPDPAFARVDFVEGDGA